MPKLPKYNHSYLFHKLAHEAKLEFEKQGRTEKWNEIQKWTTANLYPQYKGRSHKQVTPEEIRKDILFIITPPPKRKCGDVFRLSMGDYVFIYWFDVINKIEGLPKDILVRINAGQFGVSKLDHAGSFYYETDVKDITERIRIYTDNGYEDTYYDGRIKVVPNGSDDGKPCSYFLDFVLHTKEGWVDDTPPVQKTIEGEEVEDVERIKRIKIRKQQKEQARAEKAKEAKERERPSFKPVAPTPKEPIIRTDIVDAMKLIKEDYKEGIYTKEEYKDLIKRLVKRLEE
jgi:hypothetical protein